MASSVTGTSPVTFEWIAAPADLSEYVNSLYIMRAGDEIIDEMMPAYSGQLCILARGGASMSFVGGEVAKAPPAYFLTPLTRAQPFTIEAGSITLGISLNVRGWACFTGLAADKVKDGYFPVEEVLSPEVSARLLELPDQIAKGSLDEREALDVMTEIVRNGITPLSPRHEQVVSRTIEWLSASFKPEIADLIDRLPYSERQVQRLVSRFFAQTPVKVIRRFRAIRAATLLTMDGIDPKVEAEVRDAFYDQAHMIKELRYFTGKTPRRLQPAVGSVVRETLGEPGYGAVDLFGGNQDEELAKAERQ